MTSLILYKHLMSISRIIASFSLFIAVPLAITLLGPGLLLAIDFKIPPQGYKSQNCHTIKNSCESNCRGSENLSSCQNCCKRDWYLCREAKGEAGNPGDVLQPEDLAEFQEKCGETFKEKIQKKAIEGIP